MESVSAVISWKGWGHGATDNEQAWVRAAKRGDRGAFDRLVYVYGEPLRGFLVRRVGPERADDVSQETWLAAWVALPHFKARSRFKAWLYGIAVHKATDAARADGRAPATAEIDLDLVAGGRDAFADADLRHAVGQTLSHLAPEQREVLELYYYAELTLPEIARALERNVNTVKYQFYRAHAQAADSLRPFDPARTGDTL